MDFFAVVSDLLLIKYWQGYFIVSNKCENGSKTLYKHTIVFLLYP